MLMIRAIGLSVMATCVATAAWAEPLDPVYLERYGGTYSTNCENADTERLAIMEDQLVFTDSDRERVAEDIAADLYYWGRMPPEGFEIALMAGNEPDTSMLFLLHSDKKGLYILFEGHPDGSGNSDEDVGEETRYYKCGSSDEPSFGPIIEGFGPTYPINDRDVALEEGFIYRTVFDAGSYSGEPTALNSTLVSAARFLNMHGRNGVAADNMKVAVVLHGAALKSILTNDAYRSRYKIDNPNLELIGRLHDAGVDLYVCGQSLTFGGIEKQELAQPAKVALSAMTMLTVLQSKDYALLP